MFFFQRIVDKVDAPVSGRTLGEHFLGEEPLGEHFLREEHFEENPFEREEHFGENTF